MSGRCPSVSAPSPSCQPGVALCRACPQCSRCIECSECPPSVRPCVRPVSPAPGSSRTCPISPSSARYVPVSPVGSLPRWNSTKDLWIGEETKRNMPPHVYKYYLQRTMCYRRQSITKPILLGAVLSIVGPPPTPCYRNDPLRNGPRGETREKARGISRNTNAREELHPMHFGNGRVVMRTRLAKFVLLESRPRFQVEDLGDFCRTSSRSAFKNTQIEIPRIACDFMRTTDLKMGF
ncbi:hypothetical protein GWI33_013054 [Rhynchophorus ferrugineus]|uniref:Uncharacterized protein n=1 Tax=Rhynchophorus ferrugineus TaxID=354439 RepID=A0A834I4H5_RHYFE|nr:hypothetical protein GWI33_013054 [Rhynchophorus ferrugineus]